MSRKERRAAAEHVGVIFPMFKARAQEKEVRNSTVGDLVEEEIIFLRRSVGLPEINPDKGHR